MIPDELRPLFTEVAGRSLSVPLPTGRLAGSEEGRGGFTLWVSEGAVPAGLWARLRAEHHRSGLWPLLLDALDRTDAEYRPWGSGELWPGQMSSPARHNAPEILAAWWAQSADSECATQWPGLAPSRAGDDADGTADAVAEHWHASSPGLRLGLVAATRGADALTVAGWQGPANHVNDTAEISAVVRSWENRFGVRVVGVGFDTLILSVAAPPSSRRDALRVAAEHFAFCPDNVWQGPGTLAAYAEQLVGQPKWSFWWD